MVYEKGFGADVELPHARLQYRFAILRMFTAFAAQRKGGNRDEVADISAWTRKTGVYQDSSIKPESWSLLFTQNTGQRLQSYLKYPLLLKLSI